MHKGNRRRCTVILRVFSNFGVVWVVVEVGNRVYLAKPLIPKGNSG